MYKLKEITLSAYGVYQDCTFKIPKGLTRIGGRNRSGKTLIFSPLQPIIYGGEGVPNGGKAVLSGYDDDTPFTASVFNHGKSDRYSMTIDGVDQQTDTIAKSRAVLEKFFRVSQSVFTTTVMVSSKTPHPLSTGTGSSRLDWAHQTLAFSEVYNSYGDIVEASIKDLREKALRHKTLSDELSELDKDKPEKPQALEDAPDTKALSAELEELNAELDNLRAQERLPKKPSMTVEEYQEKLSKVKSRIERLREESDAYEIYKAQMALYKRAQEKFESQSSRIFKLAQDVNAPSGLSPEKLLSGARKLLKKTNSKLEAAQEINDRYEKQNHLRRFKNKKIIVPEMKNLPAEAKKVDMRFKKVEDLDATTKKLTKLMNYYEGASEDMSGECKVCGKDLGEQGKKLIHHAQAIKSMIDALEYNFCVEEANRTEFVEQIDIEPLEERSTKLSQLVKLLESVGEEIKKPKKVEFDSELYARVQEQQLSLRDGLRKAKEYYAAVPDDTKLLDPDTLRARIEKLEKRVRIKNKHITEVSDERINYETQRSLWARYVEQRKKLKAKVDELKGYPRRLKVALALRQAFGRDGLRVDRLSETLELFVANLNDCAPMIFDEPFKFDIEIGSRKCDVIAHRNNAKGNIFSLSASESRGWQAIAAMAMLRILPSVHRFDTIILDELEANMDAKSRDRFVNSYLPELRKIVDNVIVVTPLSQQEMFIPADQSYQVVKKNGVSNIKRI